MEFTHKYDSYNDYIKFQKIKSSDPVRQKKWKTIEWQYKIDIFQKTFNDNINIIKNCSNALCLGSRTGQEVVALKNLGVKKVIGIDLVSFEPYTIEGDIHNLNFDNESFDLLFTNIFDHSLYPVKFVSEMERVCKPKGYIILHLQLGIDQDRFTEVIIKNINEIKNLFVNSNLIKEQNIDTKIIAMNYELIFQKK